MFGIEHLDEMEWPDYSARGRARARSAAPRAAARA